MEESGLPTIKDMYNCTRQNYDYNVIRTYEGSHKNFSINSKPTKKSHYLDESIRLNSSPGPANKANHQDEWIQKNHFQCKRAEKATYLDDIFKKEKKLNFPSPNHYKISQYWPKRKQQLKNISQKINFADTCEYQSDKTPGPGSYNMRIQLTKGKIEKKWAAHQPLQPRDLITADVGTYSPCPLQFNTFSRYQLQKSTSHPQFKKSPQKLDKSMKENNMPGPGSYSTVSYWPGKQTSKKNEHNFFKYLTKGPSVGIYH